MSPAIDAETTAQPQPPHRWAILGLSMVSQLLIVGVHTNAFAFWVVPWMKEFGLSRGAVMLIITVSVLVGGAYAPFVGLRIDRERQRFRLLYCAAAALFALTLAMISLAPSYPVVLLLYGFLMPLCAAVCGQLGCQTLITWWFVRDRGFALGLSALGTSLGQFVIPPVAAALIAHYGWREAFQVLAAASLLALVPLGWLILRPPPQAASRAHAAGVWKTRTLLANRDFRLIAYGFMAIFIAYLPLAFGVGAYAQDLGISQGKAALATSLTAITLATGKLTFGRLADAVSHRLLYWVAALLVTLGVGVASLAEGLPMLVGGMAIGAFAMGSYLPLAGAMVVSRFGMADFGRALGLMTVFIQLGALAPVVSGVIRDAVGDYRLAFLIMLLPLLPAMLAMAWLSPTAGRPETPPQASPLKEAA